MTEQNQDTEILANPLTGLAASNEKDGDSFEEATANPVQFKSQAPSPDRIELIRSARRQL